MGVCDPMVSDPARGHSTHTHEVVRRDWNDPFTPEELAQVALREAREAEEARRNPPPASTTFIKLEEMVLQRMRKRGLSLSPLAAASLAALVETHGMHRVVEELVGIVEPVDQPVMMLAKRLAGDKNERPRAPNGNRW